MSLSVEDKFAIQELINRYAHNADFAAPEAMREIFANNGRFCVNAMDIDIEGIDNIISFFEQMRAALEGVHHVTTGTIIDAGDHADIATASSYIQTVQGAESGTTIASIGRYQDTLVRTDNGWRFQSRSVVF